MSNAPSLRPTLHPAQPTSCQGDPCPNTLLQGTSLGSTARTKSTDQHVVWRFRCACFVLFRPQKKCKARMAKLQTRDMPRDIFESWSDNYGRSSCALMRKTSCTPRHLDLVKWKGSYNVLGLMWQLCILHFSQYHTTVTCSFSLQGPSGWERNVW
jgi:hypothetical protein